MVRHEKREDDNKRTHKFFVISDPSCSPSEQPSWPSTRRMRSRSSRPRSTSRRAKTEAWKKKDGNVGVIK